MLQQVCLDDSGKDELAPAFVCAGYFGRANDLMDLADRWEALLDKEPRLAYIKGYEAFGLNEQFVSWTREERDRRLLPFVPLIEKYAGKGIAFVIDKHSFALIENLEDDDGNRFKHPHDFAYLLSLSALLQFMPDFGADAVDIVFDRDLVERRSASRAYREIYRSWPPEITNRLARREPHFEDDQQFLPLHVKAGLKLHQ